MPTYEYRCPKGHHFEVFQRISDKPEASCPQCGGPGQRQISAGAGFLLKGEGFYKTDYRSADYRKKASSEAGPGEASPGSPPAKAGGSTPSSGSPSSGDA